MHTNTQIDTLLLGSRPCPCSSDKIDHKLQKPQGYGCYLKTKATPPLYVCNVPILRKDRAT